MKFNKRLYNTNIEDTIKMNLSTQAAQGILKSKFGLFNYNYDTIFNSNYIYNYLKWDENKKKEFIITIGGKVNFKKTKSLIENKLGVLDENR
jgi:hypothetical protein